MDIVSKSYGYTMDLAVQLQISYSMDFTFFSSVYMAIENWFPNIWKNPFKFMWESVFKCCFSNILTEII
jgi:hypothetical protein